MCGDFNSTSRSGVYEYIRSGHYDCLKMEKSSISGQIYGNYSSHESPPGICFDSTVRNLGLAARDPRKMDKKEYKELIQWYTEIANTEVRLEYGDDMIPKSFILTSNLD